jgi:hypothetical protein
MDEENDELFDRDNSSSDTDPFNDDNVPVVSFDEFEEEVFWDLDDVNGLDPIDDLVLISLSSIGISSVMTTLFLSGIIEGGIFSLPIIGAYETTVAFLNRNNFNVTKTSLFRDFRQNVTKRSLCFGVFYGSFCATSNGLWEHTDISDVSNVVVSSMVSVSFATISFRRPRYVLPGVGFLMLSAYLGMVP